MIIRTIVSAALSGLAVPAALAFQAPAGQGEYLPVNQLPAADQLPAAPLLIGAYAFVWVVLMLYLWSIWRRLGKVEIDMASLQQRGAARKGGR